MKYRLTFHFKSPHPYQTDTYTQTGAPFEVPSVIKKVNQYLLDKNMVVTSSLGICMDWAVQKSKTKVYLVLMKLRFG